MQTSISALNALNFFVADVRDGLGPFLGVFLQSKNWSPAEIGVVMTIGSIAGIVATTPAGALVDRVKAKRSLIVAAAFVIVVASMTMLLVPTFPVTLGAQSANGIAAAVIAPAIAGLTLGLVKQVGFAQQLGRNEAFNHAGNVAAAVLAGLFGYVFGIGAVFVVMSAMAVAATVAVAFISPDKIDHLAARGATSDTGAEKTGFSVLLTRKPLIVLAVTLTLFHLGNAAMLPLLGQAMVARGHSDPSAFTGATIVVAQLTMVPMALLAATIARRHGYWILILLALIALPVRGLAAALLSGSWAVAPIQILDGVGAGLLGVGVPGLVARILNGTGHVNAGLGAVMTMQGLGAALSTTLAGVVAEHAGYQAAFLTLGGVAVLALVLWIAGQALTADGRGPAAAPAQPG